ncbi:bifunctional folylpolyglutamate synthase/dihydrofolate synthase [Micromonospora zamorensis]|uniref:tetrahydrofolate synthase n=1 Tax=Micromonospora zamorensis TaxID=709883 RepID=A0ABZ1PH51_9ACTN|nr:MULTISPECIES: folylpolyglutamate synthase/dihydrofolate synthase family protein [Micromonospora]MBQ0981115.1 bifunctional folylpolyglutamate synthase/dihydrofolate synthase [Micromonospora sp. M61]MBQ1038492.1 bifunctional folylpolyglutamate synthase/dihydrofolate synthase [Micromonospora sp. C81]TQJ24594.1 dihydrofolate synthase/folylpolyglutamate synthase [Micromonospora sp. A202]WSK50672.1 bifunctional folylpolyglutamate synthase/dihydrofolate synthase [Micromonospora zamorensis]WTE86775
MTDRTEFAAVEAELNARGFTRMVFELDRIESLLDLLGSPQRAYPAIHLTGTNGKTSTARMIDSLLRAHGLHTGRYTSPHLETVRERISLDGEPVSEERFTSVYREIKPLAELIDARSDEPLTYFDMTTALAFATFADAPVDIAVVEVGLGGAEDATNVIQAGVCVITPIGLDHTEWLGDTIQDIALAKAGIIHPGATVIAAAQDEEAAGPLLDRCAEVGATIAREGGEFGVLSRAVAVGGQVLSLQGLGGVYDDVFIPLHGAHQAQNAAVALAAVEAFLGAGSRRQLDVETVREGFSSTSSPGRLERVRNAPTILLDGAHNPHGMAATVTALQEEFAFSKLVAVVGVLADKDAEGLLELLEPVIDQLVVTRNSSPRAMPTDDLAALAAEIFGEERVSTAEEMPDAIELAVALAEEDVPGELSGVGVLVTGSVVTVADARRLLKR